MQVPQPRPLRRLCVRRTGSIQKSRSLGQSRKSWTQRSRRPTFGCTKTTTAAVLSTEPTRRVPMRRPALVIFTATCCPRRLPLRLRGRGGAATPSQYGRCSLSPSSVCLDQRRAARHRCLRRCRRLSRQCGSACQTCGCLRWWRQRTPACRWRRRRPSRRAPCALTTPVRATAAVTAATKSSLVLIPTAASRRGMTPTSRFTTKRVRTSCLSARRRVTCTPAAKLACCLSPPA